MTKKLEYLHVDRKLCAKKIDSDCIDTNKIKADCANILNLSSNNIQASNVNFLNGTFTTISVTNVVGVSVTADLSNISGISLTYTNASFTNLFATNATITNLNLNNTFISNISLTSTSLSDIPYVRYNDNTKELLYKRNYFGEFISTQSQTNQGGTSRTLSYTNSFTNGIFVNNLIPSQIIIPQDGIYKIGTSIQFDASEPSNKCNCFFWFRVTGTDIPDSATVVHVNSKGDIQSGYAEIIKNLSKNQYVEICISSVTNTNIEAHVEPQTTLHPLVPSVITTVYQLQ